jgi:hypothetical protein
VNKILFPCIRTSPTVTETPSKLWSFGMSCIFRGGISPVQNTGTHISTIWYHIKDHDLDTTGGRVKPSVLIMCGGPEL